MKHLAKVTRGFISAHSPCWLRKSQQKRSRCWLGNHHLNNFQRWCVDSKELSAPIVSEKDNENGAGANWEIITEKPSKGEGVDLEAFAAPVDLEKINKNGVGAQWKIITKTQSKGDAMIRQRPQPLLTQKKSAKELPKVTRGFVSTPAPVDSEIVNEN